MSLWILLLFTLAGLAFMTHPSLRYGKCRRWRGQCFAHRGLHDVSAGIVENTIPAFVAARNAGFGMELDVCFSGDRQLVVFHDSDLRRLAGDPRRVKDMRLEELRAVRLLGLEEARIPTFQEVLKAVDGQAPLLVELKSGPENGKLCRAVAALLKDYPGEYIVESFNPLIVAWFRLHAPWVVRGQLVGPLQSYRPTVNGIAGFCMAGLLTNLLSRPDFVAYDANARRFFSPHFQRFMFRTPMAAWTVTDPDLAALIEKRGEMCIFEGRGRPAKAITKTMQS
ncbi:MAG: glycerophosphodiester phosphodiesterase [Clostridia bacterium]|nr:glycerophosphodiester phosphodiesterase [Clostridia bacterium]